MTTRNMTDAQKLAEAERIENIEAQIGSEDDGDIGAGATEGLDQSNGGDPLGGGVESRKPIQHSPADDVRSQIASRFRRPEVEERPFNGDLTDAENLYGQFGREPTDEEIDADVAAAEAGDGSERVRAPAQEQQATKKKVVVRGQQMELTDDEILAAAQKTLAGDSYLEEAKSLLAQAKEIRAERTGTARQHPDGDGAQDDLGPALDDGSQHPGKLPVELVQKLQFGDPEEAAQELADYIDQRSKSNAAKAVETSGVERAFDQDLQRSQKALKAFQDANPDLANDEIAAMAIEANMYKLYREDMLGLGLTEEQLPKSNRELANYHRFYRINGYEVRGTKDLLEASKGKFLDWRGVKPASKPNPQPEQRSAKPAPRIAVSVDRDARRQAIPLQPSRASAPRRDVQAPAPADRSGVVARMRAQRGQL